MLVGVFLWLYGNFWWMEGEVVNDDDAIHAPEAGYILMVILGLQIIFCMLLLLLYI